ncbi:excisionase [Rubrivivax gelatinosus]|nr:excisionase [Rubrivivax gelatinosus]
MNDPGVAQIVAPAPYVRIPLASRITGYTEKAIRRKIAEGVWRVGKEYRKAPDGSVLISIAGYARWVETEKRR